MNSYQHHGRQVAYIFNRPESTVMITAFFFCLSAGLIFQPLRWSATPAYGNLLDIMPAFSWGIVTLVIGVILLIALIVTYPLARAVSIIGHTFAFIFILGWSLAFIVRWATDSHTTIMNVATFGILALGTIIRSATVMAIVNESTRRSKVIE